MYPRTQFASRTLIRSLAALYQLLEYPQAAQRTVAFLLVLHTGLLAYSAYAHSPTKNEPAHLVAGISHWKFGRFELYRVNPPLIRSIAAIPVLLIGHSEEWDAYYEAPGSRPVLYLGDDFVKVNGERTYFLLMIARWACIPFSWVGAVTCFLWARDLYGRPAGVLACAIWCFEPNVIAHGSLITADCHAASLGIAACYAYWKWLRCATWKKALIAGALLGLAELSKMTLVFLYPLWPLAWLLYRWPDRSLLTSKRAILELGMICSILLVSTYVINAGYAFSGSLTTLGSHHFVSDLFSGRGSYPGQQSTLPQGNGQLQHNRFAETAFESICVPLPEDYILGADIQQRDFENYSHSSFLRGNWQDQGWWYYYIYAGIIKLPIGLLLFVTIGLLQLAFGIACRAHHDRAITRDELFLLLPPLLLLCIVSSKTGFSEHFRYCLPMLPFLFVFSGRFVSLCEPCTSHHDAPPHSLQSISTRLGWRIIAAPLLLLWIAASSMWIYPHSLSYFNETVGGPLNGSQHLLGSNIDWGQDFLYAISALRSSSPHRNALYWTVAPTPALPPLYRHTDGDNPRDPLAHIISINIWQGSTERYRTNCGIGKAALSQILEEYPDTHPEVIRCGYSLRIVITSLDYDTHSQFPCTFPLDTR